METYVKPNVAEIRNAVEFFGGVSVVARILRKDRTTIHNWCKGKGAPDFANWHYLKYLYKGAAFPVFVTK